MAQNHFTDWKKALSQEIAEMKRKQNSGIPVVSGFCLSKRENFSTYWLQLYYSVSFPEGVSILLEINNRRFEGTVLSSEGKDLIVELQSNIGTNIEKCMIFNEPWELLEQLIHRLEEIEKSDRKKNIVNTLLNPSRETIHPIHKIKNTLHEAYLRSKYNEVTYIWGPPGTGKTYTLARTAAYHYGEGKKVLILSHSNAAVDVLLLEMSSFLKEKEKWKSGEIVRYGASMKEEIRDEPDLLLQFIIEKEHPQYQEKRKKLERNRRILKKRIHKSVNQTDSKRLTKVELELQKIREKLKRKEAEFIQDAKVIATTLSKAAIDPILYENEFDIVIIDEASMAYVPQIGFASTLAKNAIVCGDFMQLPPIAISRHPLVQYWLREDIFHRSDVTQNINQGALHPQLMVLPLQRRMHPDISKFTNQYIYHNQVGDHPNVFSWRENITISAPFEGEAAVLFSTGTANWRCHKEKGSRFNILSSLISLQLILISHAHGNTSIGYATPYRAQSQWMKELLQVFLKEKERDNEAHVYCSTVHKFQGSERDVILFDTVDSFPQERPGALFVNQASERLINVAMTRAKGKFICVSDPSYLSRKLSSQKPIMKLVHYLKDEAIYEDTLNRMNVFRTSYSRRLRWFENSDLVKLKKDLLASKNKIILSLKSMEDLPSGIWEILSKREGEVQINIYGMQETRIPLKNYIYHEKYRIPFIALDDKVMWFGDGLNRNSNSAFPFLARVFSTKIFHHFINLLQNAD
ncbi:DEAD/DEAH box helicase [Rossellomorea sp. BNER]|uniref:DEAD/DEAH box helicase n=1 Tax=Rossellomorea sp. BNER TaxID=2962031 RepID=UPI003AF2A89E|nr:DNA2/NAM7 family helicase [Rossellomorea sp. BNER]